MAYPVKPLLLPADLKGQANGAIERRLLRNVHPFGQLHHRAADAWWALSLKAFFDNVDLAHVGAYRTYDQQVALFKQRYTRIPIPGRPTKVWQGHRYWLKRGVAVAATPGTSNHGLGLAVDVASATGARLAWMLNTVEAYGFSWEIQSEPWHIRYVAGDNPPQAVLNALRLRDGEPVQPSVPEFRTLRRGAKGDLVNILQRALTAKGFPTPIDGDFGAATRRRVVAFQRANGLRADGVVGTQTWVALAS